MTDLGLTRDEMNYMLVNIYKVADKYKLDYTTKTQSDEAAAFHEILKIIGREKRTKCLRKS